VVHLSWCVYGTSMVPLEGGGDLVLGGLCAQTVGLVLSWFGCCFLARRRCRRRDLEDSWIGWWSQRRWGGCELRPLRFSSKNLGGKMSLTVFTFPCLSGVP
jgi:hypothetical protein